MKSKKHTTKKKVLVSALLVFLLVGGGLGAYKFMHRNDVPVTTTERQPTVNYSEATAAEKKEADANKERIVKETEEPAPSGTPSQKKAVIPTITQANPNNISSYVSGIFEEGGTCTATFTKGSTTLTKTSSGFQNVSYTQCAPINIESGFLSPGSWSVKVSYSSDTAQGTSAPSTIGVQ